MPELVFQAPVAGADRAARLVAALSEEVDRQDAISLICPDRLPETRPDRVYVLCQGAARREPEPAPDQLQRTVLVMLAPPGSDRFERGVELARRVGAAFHVNSFAVESLLASGIPARHLQLGYSPGWDSFERRSRPTELAIVDDSGGYLDWLRTLDAIHAGAVVLHEQALGLAPLVAGRHLFIAAADGLDAMTAALAGDRDRLDEVSQQAYELIREALPLALAAAALVGTARTLVAQPLAGDTRSTPGHSMLSSK
jgi:hypothetical protein